MIVPFLVIAIRLVIPLSILRWPFWGMLLAIAADAVDVVIFSAFGWGILAEKNIYHEFDKMFDIYYIALAAYASLRWRDAFTRRIAAMLFLWRFAGFALFEITHTRQIFFFAPNVFENFYLLIAATYQFVPSFQFTKTRAIILLVVAAIPKIIQEYIMHYLEFPTWAFVKHNIFFWPN